MLSHFNKRKSQKLIGYPPDSIALRQYLFNQPLTILETFVSQSTDLLAEIKANGPASGPQIRSSQFHTAVSFVEVERKLLKVKTTTRI